MARNTGGEPHTFTEVENFGGGCVDVLNAGLGLEPVAECSDPALFGSTLVFPGGSLQASDLAVGNHKFMCLIHPWMRQVIAVESD